MDFYTRSQLPIISFEEEPEFLDNALIRQALYEKPCNLVFVEVRDKLYGIASFGDVVRAGEGPVPVNRNFTVLKGKQFMKAREIFREKTNILEIPVTDEEGRLTGMCSKNDDLLYLEYNRPWEGNRYARPFLNKHKVVRVVRTPKGDVRRQRLVDLWIEEFQKYGVSCEMIDLCDILELQMDQTPILFVDEELCLGSKFLIEGLNRHTYNTSITFTFRLFERKATELGFDALIAKLAESGIKVYNMRYSTEQNTEGRRRLWKSMYRMRELMGKPYVMPSYAQGFYEEFNVGDYAAEVGKLTFNIEASNVYSRLKDVKSRYLNVVNGERITVGQPSEAERSIWFFGPCLMVGGYVEDKHTIESFLQERLNREGYSCRVVNCGCYDTPYQEMIRITSTPMKPGDVVVLHVDNQPFTAAESIDIMEILDRNNVPTEWLLDAPTHGNHKVNQIYADELFDRMVRDGALTGKANNGEGRSLLTCDLAVNTLFLDLHFDNYHPVEGERVGGIALHGNPFTLGHRYLIETASKQVDRLFALLTEDEAGILSFAERYAMAIEDTKHLPNVTIVPGGPFSGTRNDFAVYFVKVEPTTMREGTYASFKIFAEVIAKRLGITCRFIGDERHCPQMQVHNELAKEMMPSYGIEVIEIPRAQAEGGSISASRSRRAAAEGDRETLLANVSKSTYKILVGSDD